jgi:hypothetical protein
MQGLERMSLLVSPLSHSDHVATSGGFLNSNSPIRLINAILEAAPGIPSILPHCLFTASHLLLTADLVIASEKAADAIHAHGHQSKSWISKFFPSAEVVDKVRVQSVLLRR